MCKRLRWTRDFHCRDITGIELQQHKGRARLNDRKDPIGGDLAT